MIYQEYILGDPAKEYVQKKIFRCGKSLSRSLFAEGVYDMNVIAYLPNDCDIQNINYEHGGISELAYADKWIDRKAGEFISQSVNNLVVYEHALALPNDAWLQRSEIRPLILNEDIYFVAMHPDINQVSIARKLATTALVLVATMISLPKSCENVLNKEHNEIFSFFLSNIKSLIVSAFDGEGYLLVELDI